jgi:hypothetical protein
MVFWKVFCNMTPFFCFGEACPNKRPGQSRPRSIHVPDRSSSSEVHLPSSLSSFGAPVAYEMGSLLYYVRLRGRTARLTGLAHPQDEGRILLGWLCFALPNATGKSYPAPGDPASLPRYLPNAYEEAYYDTAP